MKTIVFYTAPSLRPRVPSILVSSSTRKAYRKYISTQIHSLIPLFRQDIKDEDFLDAKISTETTVKSDTLKEAEKLCQII